MYNRTIRPYLITDASSGLWGYLQIHDFWPQKNTFKYCSCKENILKLHHLVDILVLPLIYTPIYSFTHLFTHWPTH